MVDTTAITMKAFTLIAISLVASVCHAARTETVTLNLANPKQPFTLSFTDATATTVEARLKTSAVDFDSSGWTGLLWYGSPGSGGITLTNVAASAGVMTWDVTEAHVPTNGRYSVQIFGFQANRLEEWGRGALTVNSSSSKGALPAEWQSPSSVLLAAINAATNALSVSVAANLESATGALAIASEVAFTNEAALRVTGDRDSSNNVTAVRTELTNRVSAVEGYTNRAATAWQNPASAAYWTWTSDGTNATLTGYSGPAAVVIPDTLDNLPVTGFGTIFKTAAVTSISGGVFVTNILDNSFAGNTNITTISFPSVVHIGGSTFTGAFRNCTGLKTIILPKATTFERNSFRDCTSLMAAVLDSATNIVMFAFEGCTSLTVIKLPSMVTAVGNSAFMGCTSLTSVYWGDDAPAEASNVYENGTPATNYVTNPQATGWAATWNGRPVVRMPLYTDELRVKGTNLTDMIAAATNPIPSWIAAATNPIPSQTAAAIAAAMTPAGIAAAGGIVTNSIPGPGCTYLGTSQAVTLTGATTSYRAEPAGVYTVSVAQAASRYTYALEVISTNPCTLAAGLNLQGSWTITGTNILAIVPCTGTLWRVYGRGL